jgi:bifunctional non-homologous end joining protein LigD
MAVPKIKARFVEPMLLLPTSRLPEEPGLPYELKLDGFRAQAIKGGGRVQLRSRSNKDFNRRYPSIANALDSMTDETVIDGEVVAMDEAGKPSFNALQNVDHGAHVVFYAFDVMILEGCDLMAEPLRARRELLRSGVLAHLDEPIRESPELEAKLPDLIESVKACGLEGLLAKRRDSQYEPGQRSGAWQKMRVNRGQEFVIGGYTIGARGFDAIIFGYYDHSKLNSTPAGRGTASRAQLFRRFQGFAAAECPFVNVPEASSGRWGQGLTAEKMKDCRWFAPSLVGTFEFVEWTPDGQLRHVRFIGLREDKRPVDVRRK